MLNKSKRIEMLIKKNISDIILFELHDKKLGFVTVTDVKMSKDYQYARIYVSFLNAKDPIANLEVLKKARGFIRSSLSKKMDIYKIPQLEFILDDSYENAKHLEDILKKDEEDIDKINKK